MFHYSINPYPDVPYLCTEVYDGGDFQEYPARQGWSMTKLLVGDFWQGHSAEAVAAFLHTWLYFGILNELHLTGGDKVKVANFTKKKNTAVLLSSVKLEKYVANWASGLKVSWFATKKSARLQRAETALDTLCILSESLYCLCSKEGGSPPLLDDIVLSFKILG